jgi:hypothetical protein
MKHIVAHIKGTQADAMTALEKRGIGFAILRVLTGGVSVAVPMLDESKVVAWFCEPPLYISDDVREYAVGTCLHYSYDETITRVPDADVSAVSITDTPHANTASGYGRKLPTQYRLRIGSRWHRVYAVCFSNSGSLYVIRHGVECYLEIATEHRMEIERDRLASATRFMADRAMTL